MHPSDARDALDLGLGDVSTSAAVERQDREHGARELHGRASAGELVEVAAALGEPPELLGDVAGERLELVACGQRRRRDRRRPTAAPPRSLRDRHRE